jgi:hypothetical protein
MEMAAVDPFPVRSGQTLSPSSPSRTGTALVLAIARLAWLPWQALSFADGSRAVSAVPVHARYAACGRGFCGPPAPRGPATAGLICGRDGQVGARGRVGVMGDVQVYSSSLKVWGRHPDGRPSLKLPV